VTYYLLKPCKTSAGFTVTLKKRTRLNLKDAKTKLEAAGYTVTDVEVMLTRQGPAELTLYESGKLLVKKDDKTEAQQVTDSVYGLLGLAAAPTENVA